MSTGIKIYSEKDIKRICKEEILKKCLKEDYRKIDESGRKMLYKIMNLVEQSKLKEVLEIIDTTKIIKDEFCQCGCSKKVHSPHQLDKNGGRCNNCVHCPIYTWASFEFVDLGELKEQISKELAGREE